MHNILSLFYNHIKYNKLILFSGISIAVFILKDMDLHNYLIMFGCFILWIFLKDKGNKSFIDLVLILFAVILSIARYESYIYEGRTRHEHMLGKEIVLEGMIVEEPETISGNKIKMIVKSLDFGRILVYLNNNYTPLKPGNIVKVKGLVEDPPEFEDFSYKNHLQTEGIFYLLQNASLLENSPNRHIVYAYKNYLLHLMNKHFPSPAAELLQGMLLGVKTGFGENLEQDLKVSGLMHITAVSGYNINLLFNFLYLLSGKFNRRLINLVAFVFLGYFGVMVGLYNYSALRAVSFSIITIIGKLVGRNISNFTLIIIATVLILWFNPFSYRSAGFLLSLAAVYSMFYFANIIQRFFHLGEVLSASIAVSLMLGTLQVYLFGNFSFIGILANLIVSPIISIIMFVGMLYVLAVGLLPILGELFTIFLTPLINIFILVISLMGNIKYAFIEDIKLEVTTVYIIFSLMTILVFINYYYFIKNKLSRKDI